MWGTMALTPLTMSMKERGEERLKEKPSLLNRMRRPRWAQTDIYTAILVQVPLPASSAQNPGHMGSIPAERVSTEMDNGEARLARDMGWSLQQQSHLCSIPAERASTALDEEEARLERDIGVLL